MIKLSDSQLVVLTAACQRADGCVFPVTPTLKGNAAGNVLKSLLNKSLLQEVRAEQDDTVWRHDEAEGPLTLRATAAAHAALGIEPADGGAVDAPVAATRAARAPSAGSRPPVAKGAAVKPARGSAKTVRATRREGGGAARADTKQARLIAMLKAPKGATIAEIIDATGWQAHTVRGALSGALKKKLGLNVTSEKVEGRGRVYRIAT
jgi:hypothetical protein